MRQVSCKLNFTFPNFHWFGFASSWREIAREENKIVRVFFLGKFLFVLGILLPSMIRGFEGEIRRCKIPISVAFDHLDSSVVLLHLLTLCGLLFD